MNILNLNMSYSMGKYLLQMFILLTLFILSQEETPVIQDLFCFKPSVPTMIDVVNNLPPNSVPLNVHCFSGDDDKGNHTLKVDEDFYFDFCDSETTLYSCSFRWNGKFKSFVVFNGKWVDNNNYYWTVKSDGIHLSYEYPPKKNIMDYYW